MKKLSITLLIISIGLFILNGCSDNETEPQISNNDINSKLVGTNWKIKTVIVDGVDYSANYNGMMISFTKSSFTTSNGGIVWPSTGTWQLKATDNSTITRNDGIDVKIGVTDTQLELSLYWAATTYSGGRINSVKGNHTFTFTK